MGRGHLNRYPLTNCIALALLAGCGGSQPISAPGAMPQSRLIAAHADRSGSWMLPEAKSEDLLYVANEGLLVYVYSYPAGKLVGTLTIPGYLGYECSDKGGNVFITTSGGSNAGVYEYAHGSSQPTNYLPLVGAHACSVDPTTDNLAVIKAGNGSVYVYAEEQGTPTVYTDPNLSVTSGVAYDESDNLFINGDYWTKGFALVELPRGSSTFEDIHIQGSFGTGSMESMAWDGSYLGLGTLQNARKRRISVEVVERIQVSGSVGAVVGEVPLAVQQRPAHPQFAIRGSVAIDLSDGRKSSYFAYFRYPGGKQTNKVKLAVDGLVGVAFSAAPSHK